MENNIRAIHYDPRDEANTMAVLLGRYATHGGDIFDSDRKAADA